MFNGKSQVEEPECLGSREKCDSTSMLVAVQQHPTQSRLNITSAMVITIGTSQYTSSFQTHLVSDLIYYATPSTFALYLIELNLCLSTISLGWSLRIPHQWLLVQHFMSTCELHLHHQGTSLPVSRYMLDMDYSMTETGQVELSNATKAGSGLAPQTLSGFACLGRPIMLI